MFVLDTDISIFLLRGRAATAVERLRKVDENDVAVAAVTAAELRFGAVHSGNPRGNLEQVERFLAPLALLPFDDHAALHFAIIKQQLAKAGFLIGTMELLIAATVRAHGATLVTNNVREFSRVSGLAVENWLE